MFRPHSGATDSEPAVGPTLLPGKLVSACLSPVTKCLVCEAHHRLPFSAEKNEWGYTSAAPYVFMTLKVTV